MGVQVLTKDKLGRYPQGNMPLRRIKAFDLISLASLASILGIFLYAGYFTREYLVPVTRISLEYPYQAYTKLSIGGRLVIEHKSSVYPRIAGQISEIMVQKGDLVKKGQVLARLEDTDAVALKDQRAANLDLANANLDQARLVYSEAALSHENNAGLYRSGTLSEADHHNSETALRKAKSALSVAEATVRAHTVSLRNAEINLGYTIVRAPFDGIVLSRNAHVSDMVRPLLADAGENGGIVTLADLSSLQAEVAIPESQMDYLKTGQPCIIVVDALKTHFRGEVDSIVPPVGADKATAFVRVVLHDRDPRLMPDMAADVSFLSQQIMNEGDKPLFM
ncbi:efflux RND transporter periplasmic adaptor subunit, partial [archaeon]|nr:efflux RND transporter periplasmic adaptor subunit [archaeon]